MQQLAEFAGEHGMSAGPLRNLMKSVLLVPQGETHSSELYSGLTVGLGGGTFTFLGVFLHLFSFIVDNSIITGNRGKVKTSVVRSQKKPYS